MRLMSVRRSRLMYPTVMCLLFILIYSSGRGVIMSSNALSAQIAERAAKMEAMKAAQAARKGGTSRGGFRATAAPPIPQVSRTPPVVPAAVVAPPTPPNQDLGTPIVEPAVVPIEQPPPPSAELEALKSKQSEQLLTIRTLEDENTRLKQSEALRDNSILDLQKKVSTHDERYATLESELQVSQTEHAAARAEARHLQFDVERIQQDMEAQSRRLATVFNTKSREELYLWCEHYRIEVEEVEDRMAIERTERSRAILEAVRNERRDNGTKLKRVVDQHGEEINNLQDELHQVESNRQHALESQSKQENLTNLAKKQLEDYKDLQEKEAEAIRLEKQRRQHEMKKILIEKEEALLSIATASENEKELQSKMDAMRQELDKARSEKHTALSALSDEREDRMRSLKTLKEQLYRKESDRSELMKKVPALEEQRSQLEEKILRLERSQRESEQETRQIRQEREDAELKVGEIRQHFREKQKGDELEILRLLRNDRSWRIERAEMEEEIRRMSSEIATKNKDSLSIQKEFSQLAKKTNKAQKKHRDIKQENIEMSQRLESLAREGVTARKLMASEVSNFKAKHKNAADHLDTEAAKMREYYDTTFRFQEEELKKYKAEVGAKDAQVADLTSRLQNLQTIEKYSTGFTPRKNIEWNQPSGPPSPIRNHTINSLQYPDDGFDINMQGPTGSLFPLSSTRKLSHTDHSDSSIFMNNPTPPYGRR